MSCGDAGRARALRIAGLAMAWMLALCGVTGTAAYGQASAADSTPGVAQPSSDEPSGVSGGLPTDNEGPGEDRDASTGPGRLAPQGSLSSDQIIAILQRNPDLTEELKSQSADRMQLQGADIDATDISDRMLYSQIASNAALRASITTYLRAGGYVSSDDLRSAAPGIPEEDEQDALATPANTDGADTRFRVNQEHSRGGQMRADRFRRHTAEEPRHHEMASASTDTPRVLRQPVPYDLQSMRDLYTQIPDDASRLKRFGSDVFVNRNQFAASRGISGRDTPLDVPLGPDYIVGAGDTLTIEMWGGITKTILRTINRDGSIFLPEAGSLQIAGFSLGQAQTLIEKALRKQYRDARIAVTISRLRSVRVYVVGDVQRPGGYDISSLATPLSALYAAGGPTTVGSLRTLLHYRGKHLVEKVDLYDFLLHGIRDGSARFQSGDTLLVPPAGAQAAVFGAVKRPAIYELTPSETTLAVVIDDAGGFTAAASLDHIRIERISANHQRETVTLPGAGGRTPQAIAVFRVSDGDRIRVEPILPYSRRAVYLTGHVVRPGRLPYTDGMRLSDVLRSSRDMLPEPAARGEIIRLVPPDLHAETIDFNVPDVLIGNENVDLQPFDTIRISGRYEADAPKVTIRGDVLRPGTFPMSKGMTAAQLVRMAGGFKRDALLQSADLASYGVKNGNRVEEDVTAVRIGAAVSGTDPSADVPLKPGDILSIHQITNWDDIGESVTIAGQVRFPGSYGFHDGERLSAVLRKAGGLLPTAYPMGAVLIREQVRDLEQKSREELIRQIETNSAAARLSPNLGGSNASGELQLIKAQQDEVLSELKSHPPSGRMVIHISADIDSWANTPADIELRRGDVLTIPKRPGFVLVTGQVYNATALAFTPHKTANWYLSRAGGTNTAANRKEIFIIRANGSVVGRHSGGWFGGDVLSTRLNPGDLVVVPQKIIGSSLFWRNLLAAGQLAASVAITAGVAAAAL